MSGLNTVWELNPGEIQLGILKRLRGAPISRHTKTFDMVYDSRSPYSILCNSLLSYGDVQFLKRYSKYWDLVVNSGHFKVWVFSLDKIRLDSNLKFSDIFKNLTDFLWSKHKQLHSIALQNLTQSLHEFSLKYFLDHFNVLQNALVEDYCIRGKRDKPKFFGDAKVIRQLEKTTILSNHQTHQDRQLRHLN
jgi:hypothetical protein